MFISKNFSRWKKILSGNAILERGRKFSLPVVESSFSRTLSSRWLPYGFIYTGADLLLGPSSNLHKKVSVFHGVVVPTGIQPKNYASRWPLSGTNYPGKTSRNRRIYHLRIHPCTSNLLFPSRIFASRFDRCPIVLDSDSSIFLRVFSFCIRACYVILSFDLCSIFLFFFSLRKDKSPGFLGLRFNYGLPPNRDRLALFQFSVSVFWTDRPMKGVFIRFGSPSMYLEPARILRFLFFPPSSLSFATRVVREFKRVKTRLPGFRGQLAITLRRERYCYEGYCYG